MSADAAPEREAAATTAVGAGQGAADESTVEDRAIAVEPTGIPDSAPPPVPATTPSPVPEAAAPKGNAVQRLFRRLGPVGRVVSGLVAAISFVTGIIAVVPIFTADSTGFSSLKISAAPFSGPEEYAVPSSAAFSTFPAGAPGSCGADQRRWLTENGTRITTRYLIDLRNVASSGPMLALKSFRAKGKLSDDGAAAIRIVCDPGGTTSKVQAARLPVGDPAQVAYFDKSAFGQTAPGIPDSPLVWNLAPGETGQIVLDLYPTRRFTGAVTATVFSGSEHRDVTIEMAKAVDVPRLVEGGMTFLRVDGALQCVRIDGDDEKSCDLAQVLKG